MKLSDIVLQDLQCFLMFHLDKFHNFLVQKCLCLERTAQAGISAQILVCHVLHGNHVKVFTHTISGDHRSCKLGRLFNIVGGSGCDGMEDQFLCSTSACKSCDLVLQFLFCHQVMISVIYLHSVTKRTGCTRNDRNLVNRCRLGLLCGNQCMSDLMVGNDQFFLIGKNTVLLLISGDNYLDALFKVCLCGKFSALTYCTQCCFIDDVRKLCTGSSGCCFSNLIKAYGISNLNLLCMNFKDLFTSF